MENTIVQVLETVIKNQKNIDTFKSRLMLFGDDEEIREALYEVVWMLSKGAKIKDTFRKLATRNLGFDGDAYEKQRIEQKEEDDFLTSPAEVEEGVHTCDKCGSKRTVSYTLQTRGGDESTSVWAQCVECGQKWRA